MFDSSYEYVEDGIRFKSTLNVCNAAATLVDELRKPRFDDIFRIEGSVGSIIDRIEALKEASSYDEENNTSVVPTSLTFAWRRADKGIIYYNLMHNGRNNVQAPPVDNGELIAAQEQLKKACNKLDNYKKEISDQDVCLGPTMKEDFLHHAHGVFNPYFNEYNQIFHKTVGSGEVVPDFILFK